MPTRLEIDCNTCQGSGLMKARDLRPGSVTHGERIDYPCGGCNLAYDEHKLTYARQEIRAAINEHEPVDCIHRLQELLKVLDE